MKKHSSTIILVLILLIGLSLILYPSFSDWWNSMHQSRAIANYDAILTEMEAEDYSHLFEAALAYNLALAEVDFPLMYYDEVEGYFDLLDVTGTGIMGYIDIPKIDIQSPIYHGTSEGVLQIAVGHIQGSSLPTGGVGTHCALSAHRGLPTAVLVTHLDRMEIGDTFYFTILDRTITYEVDEIRIVEPNDTSLIRIADGKDYCTLLTCTPFGINTQRLLVRGHQIDATQTRNIYIGNEAYRIKPLIVMPIVALPIIFVLLIYVMVAPVKKETLGEDLL